MTMPYSPYAPYAPSAAPAPSWMELLTPTQCPCCGQAVMPTPQNYMDAFSSSMDAFTSSMSQWMGAGAGAGRRPQPRLPARGRGRPCRRGPAEPGRPGTAGAVSSRRARTPTATSTATAAQGGLWVRVPRPGTRPRHMVMDTARAVVAVMGTRPDADQCRADDCHCQCCIGDDLDLVVYSRLGERRVIPITLTNERRREREVTLELSAFTTKGGRALPFPVTGTIAGESTFTLAPCEERAVVIEVASEADTPVTNDQPGKAVDVDDCLVAVADLRVTGCDIRCPIGIGVVLLPRDCDTFDLSCGCGCC